MVIDHGAMYKDILDINILVFVFLFLMHVISCFRRILVKIADWKQKKLRLRCSVIDHKRN